MPWGDEVLGFGGENQPVNRTEMHFAISSTWPTQEVPQRFREAAIGIAEPLSPAARLAV
jgi:hypothetical protein